MKKLRSKLVIIFSVCVLTECRFIMEPELEIHPLSSTLDDSKRSLTDARYVYSTDDDRYFYSTDAETDSTNIEKIKGKTHETEFPMSDTTATRLTEKGSMNLEDINSKTETTESPLGATTVTSSKITTLTENSPKKDSNERLKRQDDDSSSIQGTSSEELPEDSSNPYDSSDDDDSNLENFSEGEVRNKKDVTPPKSTLKTSPTEPAMEETTTEGTEQPETTVQSSHRLPERDFFGIFLRFAMKSDENIHKRSVQGWFPSQDEEEEEHMQAAEQNVFRPLFAYRQQQALRRRLRTPPVF